MKAKPVMIDRSLVVGDFLFATHRDRALYIGKLVRDRPRWLKDNPGAWRRIADVQQETASLPRRVESEDLVEAIAAGQSSHMSSPDVRDDGKDNAGSVEIPAAGPSPPQQPAMMLPLAVAAPSASGVDEIAIGTRRYVSAQLLASIRGISLRTLSRRCAAGKGPPKIKIGNKAFFELGKNGSHQAPPTKNEAR